MKYKIVNDMILDNNDKPIKHYRELPYGFGHFLPSNVSIDGIVTATSFGKGDKHEISPNKKDENNF